LLFAEKAVGTTPQCNNLCSRGQAIDLTSFDDFHYPPEFPTVIWPGQVKTKLPFVASPNDPTVNILQDEATHVEALARTATLTSKWIVELNYNEFADDRAFAFAVANEIKWGRTVVAKGHPYRRASVELDDLNLRFNYVKEQEVYASG
jgi:hypothetical protein